MAATSSDLGANQTDHVVLVGGNDAPKTTTTGPTNGGKGSSSSRVNAATFNLIKAIAGSGVLALPSGLAAMGDYEGSLLLAVLLMAGLGGVSAYTFALYGRLVHTCRARSLGELWRKIQGERSAWFVSVTSLTFCLGGLLSYSILLGDVAQSLSQTVGLNVGRQFWIVFLTGTVLSPLCNLKSLLALAPLSLAGVLSVLITTLFIIWRCPFVNPASPYGAGGALLTTLTALQVPRFHTVNRGFASPSSLVIFGMAVSAYL
jgi:sodium-coupled neutral amino acid transporter 11